MLKFLFYAASFKFGIGLKNCHWDKAGGRRQGAGGKGFYSAYQLPITNQYFLSFGSNMVIVTGRY
jgi:hypothetical protein